MDTTNLLQVYLNTRFEYIKLRSKSYQFNLTNNKPFFSLLQTVDALLYVKTSYT